MNPFTFGRTENAGTHLQAVLGSDFMVRAGKTKQGRKKTPACPQCGSSKVIPVVYDTPTPEVREAVRRRRAVLADCEEWEGRPEWHCAECGCDWRGGWTRFKKSNAQIDSSSD